MGLAPVFVDFETSSACPIDLGSWAYSQHDSTVVLCASFTVAGRVISWEPGGGLPGKLFDHIHKGAPVVAHNAAFEKSILANILCPLWGFPEIRPEQWDDTQALGAALNLPLNLAWLAKALGMEGDDGKDKEGYALMMKMCKRKEDPENPGQYVFSNPKFHTREHYDRLIDYCETDTLVTAACYKKLPKMSEMERAVWLADQAINERGFRIDRVLANNMQVIVEGRKEELKNEAVKLTNMFVEDSSVANYVKDWLLEMGVDLPLRTRKRKDGTKYRTASLDKKAVEALLEDDLQMTELFHGAETPPKVKALLRNRQEAAKATSLAKLKKLELRVDGRDSRLRFPLRYSKASTGRWTAQGFQSHNIANDKREPEEAELTNAFIDAGDLKGLQFVTDNPLDAVSKGMRRLVVPAPGYDFVAGDWSAIEARVNSWLAGDIERLAVFASGKDIYTHTANQFGGTRQDGKMAELALGYGMGEYAFATRSDITFAKARSILKPWRKNNKKIVAFWRELEDAAKAAINRPGTKHYAGIQIYFICKGGALRMVLPSGRSLLYWRPQIVPGVKKKIRQVNDAGVPVWREMVSEEIQFFKADKGAMLRDSTYGGKLCENACQAVARELLAEALVRVDARSDVYKIVLHVHDSICTEVKEGEGSVEELCALMEASPGWALGLPLAVDGYRSKRFEG